jgi:hypothetical protein
MGKIRNLLLLHPIVPVQPIAPYEKPVAEWNNPFVREETPPATSSDTENTMGVILLILLIRYTLLHRYRPFLGRSRST